MDISPGSVDYIPAGNIYPNTDVGMNIIPMGELLPYTRDVGVDHIPGGEDKILSPS